MKKNTKKSILQKTIVVITIIITFNFIAPNFSNAGVVSDIASSVGGIIFNAVADLLETVGDGLLGLVQYFMLGDVGNNKKDENGEGEGKFLGLIHTKVMVDKDSEEAKEIEGGAEDAEKMPVSADDLDLGRASKKQYNYQVPVMKYTPEEIFKGKTPFLQVNFINPSSVTDSQGREVEGISQTLHKTIANWYIALRNLSIVGLLSILVYVGIRILISSVASDKAKYKQMFTDWLVALCLVFFLHYIMAFVLMMTESVTNALANDDKKGSIVISVTGNNDVSGGTYTTNVMGAARFMTQTKDNVARLSYLVIYLILIGYTILFTFTYLKRTLMMAFLTVIAPLVALTYPIDKMNDGQAQAFNMWLKEFVFNALLQPFHLIIYYVFVMSAIELSTNPIYVIAVMLFILPAEKILRSFFGFDKASKTVGALTGFAAASMLSGLGKGGSKAKAGGKAGGADGAAEETPERPPRMQNDPFSEIEAGNANGGGTNTQGGTSEAGNNEDGTGGSSTRTLDGGTDTQDNSQQQNLNNNMQGENQNSGTAGGAQANANQNSDNDSQADSSQNSRGTRMSQGASSTAKSKKQIKGFRGGMRNLGKRYVRPKKLAHGVLKGAGMVARAASTVAGAGAGVVLGVASGKGLAGAVTGAVTGARLGSNAARGAENLAHKAVDKASELPQLKNSVRNKFEEIRDTFKEGSGQQIDYSKRDFRDYQENENNRKYLNDKFYKKNGRYATKSEMKDLMEADKAYVERGFSDAKQISDLKQAEKAGYTAEESAFAAAIVKDRYEKKDLSDKNFGQTQEALAQTIMAKREGISKEQALEKSERILQIARYQNGLGAVKKETATSQTQSNSYGNPNNGRTNTKKGTNKNRGRRK